MRAEQRGLANMKYLCDGRVTLTVITFEEEQELSIADEDMSTVIDVIRSIEGVELCAAVRESVKGEFRVSMRSNGDVDVAYLCAGFGGGGHQRAAGCTVRAESAEEAEEKVRACLEGAII